MPEGARDEVIALRPSRALLRHHLVHLHDPRRRERAGKRRRGAGREGQRRCIVEIEIAFHLAVGAAPIGELKHEMVVELVDQRRIVDLNQLMIAVIVGQRHEQVEPVPGGKQRSGGASRCTHRAHRVVQQGGHDASAERRPKPARAHEQR